MEERIALSTSHAVELHLSSLLLTNNLYPVSRIQFTHNGPFSLIDLTAFEQLETIEFTSCVAASSLRHIVFPSKPVHVILHHLIMDAAWSKNTTPLTGNDAEVSVTVQKTHGFDALNQLFNNMRCKLMHLDATVYLSETHNPNHCFDVRPGSIHTGQIITIRNGILSQDLMGDLEAQFNAQIDQAQLFLLARQHKPMSYRPPSQTIKAFKCTMQTPLAPQPSTLLLMSTSTTTNEEVIPFDPFTVIKHVYLFRYPRNLIGLKINMATFHQVDISEIELSDHIYALNVIECTAKQFTAHSHIIDLAIVDCVFHAVVPKLKFFNRLYLKATSIITFLNLCKLVSAVSSTWVVRDLELDVSGGVFASHTQISHLANAAKNMVVQNGGTFTVNGMQKKIS